MRCATEDLCAGEVYALGFCHKHYSRWKKHGRLHRVNVPGGQSRDSLRRKSRARYLRTRDKRLAYEKARRNADPEAARERERQIRARRAERHRADARARERRIGSLDADSLAYAQILQCDPCSYCGGPMEHVDHITPVADAGANHWTNLTAACQPCNRAKSTHSLLHFSRSGR